MFSGSRPDRIPAGINRSRTAVGASMGIGPQRRRRAATTAGRSAVKCIPAPGKSAHRRSRTTGPPRRALPQRMTFDGHGRSIQQMLRQPHETALEPKSPGVSIGSASHRYRSATKESSKLRAVHFRWAGNKHFPQRHRRVRRQQPTRQPLGGTGLREGHRPRS